jgi:hypothetical protein
VTIGDGLLQQLRIDLFQPLETRIALKPGQFSRKSRPGDGFAGLLISFFSTLERPVKDEPSRARITSKRRLLFGGRINSESVDLSFRHSISGPLRVDVFGNLLLGYSPVVEAKWLFRDTSPAITAQRGPGILLSGCRRVNGATPCFAPCQIHPPLEAEGFLWLFCRGFAERHQIYARRRENLYIDLECARIEV